MDLVLGLRRFLPPDPRQKVTNNGAPSAQSAPALSA
jgi:hypothetical protein